MDLFGQMADQNPNEQTVEMTLNALRVQNDAGRWCLTKDDFGRLATTAPAWPKGKDAFRSLRIRWGKGADGVYITFERHWEAMRRTHAKVWRWPFLHSKPGFILGKEVEHLRLLNGNDTHKAVVEWVIIDDLSANGIREDVTSVRGAQSLADEGLVIAWLFPKRADAINYREWCAWYCGGYEVNVPIKRGTNQWQHVVAVNRRTVSGELNLGAFWRSDSSPGYSVPKTRGALAA